MAKGTPLLKRALMALVATLLFLVGVEAACRAWEWHQHGAVNVGVGPVGLYEDHPVEGGAALRPGAQMDGAAHQLRVNSLGFRGEDIAPQKRPGAFRVWCLGGSTTFDIMVSDDASAWPAQLQARLRETAPDRTIEVVNAGVPGEVLRTNLRDLRRHGPVVRPDVVIVYTGVNDLRRVAGDKYGVDTGEAPAWMSNLSAWRVLGDLVPIRSVPSEWRDHRLTRDDLGPLKRDLGDVIAEGQRLGATVVIASHALSVPDDATGWSARLGAGREALTYRLAPEAYISAMNEMNALFRDEAVDRGLPFADVRVAVGTDDRFWGDTIHFTDEGAARAGEALADFLVDQGLVNGRRGPTAPP